MYVHPRKLVACTLSLFRLFSWIFFWKPEYPLARILTNVLIKRCYTKRKHATFLNLELSRSLFWDWNFVSLIFQSLHNKLLFSFWAEKRCNFVDNNSSRIPTIVLSKKEHRIPVVVWYSTAYFRGSCCRKRIIYTCMAYVQFPLVFLLFWAASSK